MSNKMIKSERSNLLDIDFSSQDANLTPVFLQRYDREQTRISYRNDLSHFFGTAFITLRMVTRISFLHINEYLTSLERDGYKSNTLKRRVACLRGFFDWLLALELIPSNPLNKQLLRRIRSSGSNDARIMFLTANQVNDLIQAVSDNPNTGIRNAALIRTMIHCVLRRSEVTAMNVSHIRPLGHYWIVDLPETKSGADQYVKIPAHVVDDIESMKNHYNINSGALWRSLSNNNKGGRLSPQSVYNIVRNGARKAGITESIGAHTLRHTGCTLAIDAGASFKQVQTHARHKRIDTTMVYIHQRDKLRDSAADYIHIENKTSSSR